MPEKPAMDDIRPPDDKLPPFVWDFTPPKKEGESPEFQGDSNESSDGGTDKTDNSGGY